MEKLEAEIERAISTWCDERGILHAKFSPFGRNGYPDHIYFIPGGFPVLAEIKRPGEPPRKLQNYVILSLQELKYDVCVFESKVEATTYLEKRIFAHAHSRTARIPT